MKKKIKIILFILLIMIISVIFILIINKYTKDKFTNLLDILEIPESQKKTNLINDTDALIITETDDKTLNQKKIYRTGPPGPPGPRGYKGIKGNDARQCKCKMPLLKFQDEKGNILGKYPENNYPTSEKIIEEELEELVITIPNGKKGETGRQGVMGPNGFGYPNE